MSIPPLVCSTPPPPDQCEDYKDPDEFGLQYLSQDDYDENDDYDNFSTFSDFQTASSAKQDTDIPIVKTAEQGKSNDDALSPEVVKEVTNSSIESDSATNENKMKFEEETNIEDLNLIVDKETIEQTDNKELCVETDAQLYSVANPISDIQTPNSLPDEPSDLSGPELPSYEYTLESTSVDSTVGQSYMVQNEQNDSVDLKANITIEEVELTDESFATETEPTGKQIQENKEDDFDDFEDFHFVSSDRKPVVITSETDNPWGGEEVEANDFGNFEAKFDVHENQIIPPSDTQAIHSNYEEIKSKGEPSISESNDDFGDFDDFKSSINETESCTVSEEPSSCQQSPMLNLQSSDSETQVMESINSVLSTIFEQEIKEPESEFDCKLETLLSETWRHLLETDVRQPYMVNWNNSVGQKTLLKALCIDSRNILFGPKWNYNMPKYAANLSVAPLQPQKQVTPSNTTVAEAPSIDKTAVKATGLWSDTFSSDGQESCNTDSGSGSGNGNNAVETGPTDLDVFQASTSSKADKIYSSTLSVQPLRQISLPDTHIFTPTDSETPRSKTIHYDSSPTMLLPQTVVDNSKAQNLTAETKEKTVVSNLENDNEYWEFQDFKGTASTSAANASSHTSIETIETKSNTNITYGVQVLQPIKVEPIMPTLNWPDPGEVKETFEDFSDFISNSSWNKEKQDVPALESVTQPVDTNYFNTATTTSSKEVTPDEKIIAGSNEVDDDFNTFQSALPSNSSVTHNQWNSDGHTMPSTIPPQTSKLSTELDNIFSSHNQKSDSISNEALTTSKVSSMQKSSSFNLDNTTNTKKSPVKSSSVQPSVQQNNAILQPIVASSSTGQNHQKSAQILQPLSLESYSQINWPNPGIDLQDLSRFNPVETLQSLKTDLTTNSQSKVASPVHNQKASTYNQMPEEDIWGDFVSSKPKTQHAAPKKASTLIDDDEWTDFVSSPTVKPQNGLNTISLNVHTNLNIQKSGNQGKFPVKSNQIPLDIPTLNYITPKSSTHKTYKDRHFQNL